MKNPVFGLILPEKQGESAGSPGGPFDGSEDPVVYPAAAKIVGYGRLDFLIGRIGISIQQGLGGHDHAGDAKAALDGMFFHKGLLERMQILGGSQTFQGGNFTALNGPDR